jgi:hypothetical protein
LHARQPLQGIFYLQGVEKLYILAEKKTGFFTEAIEADNIIHTLNNLTIDARVYEGNFSLHSKIKLC